MFKHLDRFYDQNQNPEHCHKSKNKMIFNRTEPMKAILHIIP